MVQVEKKDMVACLTVGPSPEPAGDPTPVEAIATALGELPDDDAVRAIVLRAEPGVFADPMDVGGENIETLRDRARAVMAAFERIERFPGPIVAEVADAAIGWGCEVLFAVDLVVCAQDSEFGLSRGLDTEFPAYGLLRGPEVIGAHWTKLLAFSSRRIDAQEANRIGLVYQAVPARELSEHAEALAESIALNAPLGVAAGKSLAGRRRDDGGREHAAEALAGALTETIR